MSVECDLAKSAPGIESVYIRIHTNSPRVDFIHANKVVASLRGHCAARVRDLLSVEIRSQEIIAQALAPLMEASWDDQERELFGALNELLARVQDDTGTEINDESANLFFQETKAQIKLWYDEFSRLHDNDDEKHSLQVSLMEILARFLAYREKIGVLFDESSWIPWIVDRGTIAESLVQVGKDGVNLAFDWKDYTTCYPKTPAYAVFYRGVTPAEFRTMDTEQRRLLKELDTTGRSADMIWFDPESAAPFEYDGVSVLFPCEWRQDIAVQMWYDDLFLASHVDLRDMKKLSHEIAMGARVAHYFVLAIKKPPSKNSSKKSV